MNYLSMIRTQIFLFMLLSCFINIQSNTTSIKQDLPHNTIVDCHKQLVIDKPITVYTIPAILIGTDSTGGSIITGGVGPILIGSGIAIGAWLIDLISKKRRKSK